MSAMLDREMSATLDRLARAWAAWKRIAAWIGDKQARVVYAILWLLVLGPLALARRPFSDPLLTRARRSPSFWLPRVPTPAGVESARRQ